MSVQEFLDRQASAYQSHVNVISRTQATLKHQYQIQAQGTIPKKHRPLPPVIVTTDSNKESFNRKFHQQYQELFFNSLQDAITKNTVNLELEKARCKDILIQTERELCSANETGPVLAKRYNTFLQRLSISNHQILPELRSKFKIQSVTQEHKQATKTDEKQPPQLKPRYIPSSTATYNSKNHHTTSKKRKHIVKGTNPPPKKQMKLDSFLLQGPKPSRNRK